jgi:hypothetical protein
VGEAKRDWPNERAARRASLPSDGTTERAPALSPRSAVAGTTIRGANVLSRETDLWRAWEATEKGRDFPQRNISRLESLNLRKRKPSGRGRAPQNAPRLPQRATTARLPFIPGPWRTAAIWSAVASAARHRFGPAQRARPAPTSAGLPLTANPPLINGPILRFMGRGFTSGSARGHGRAHFQSPHLFPALPHAGWRGSTPVWLRTGGAMPRSRPAPERPHCINLSLILRLRQISGSGKVAARNGWASMRIMVFGLAANPGGRWANRVHSRWIQVNLG